MSAACPAFGFALVLRFTPGLDAAGRGALEDALAAAAASHGLSAAGTGGRYVITRDGGQAIDADREVLRSWAARRSEVAEATVGPLIDLRDEVAILRAASEIRGGEPEDARHPPTSSGGPAA